MSIHAFHLLLSLAQTELETERCNQLAVVEGEEEITSDAKDTNTTPRGPYGKCRNRECKNKRGQPGKPRSLYCSPKCQSREQNLRQGRIKFKRRKSFECDTPKVQTFKPEFQNYNHKAMVDGGFIHIASFR